MAELHKADAVFEGGGVKGIALVGALSEMEKVWQWENVAGTSAGAIVAALTATGMSAQDIKGVLDKINLQELMDEAWEDRLDRILSFISIIKFLPKLGELRRHVVSLIKDFGIYEGTGSRR